MGLIALLIGMVLIVAAVRNSQGALFSALGKDVPVFAVWAAAIIAVGAIGVIPGLKPVSRWLLALIIVVIIVNNYQRLVTGFGNAWQTAKGTGEAGAKAAQTTSSGESGNSAATGAAPATGVHNPDFWSGFLETNPFTDFLHQ